MSDYADDLLDAAGLLLARRKDQRGRLPRARISRSISSSYYALFHFLTQEASASIVGSRNSLRRRRRILSRAFTHAGLRSTLEKVKASRVDASISEFLAMPSGATPRFAQTMAAAFAAAQVSRHDADYDRNVLVTEADARLVATRVRQAISVWKSATTSDDRDFKHALFILMVLKGRLRADS